MQSAFVEDSHSTRTGAARASRLELARCILRISRQTRSASTRRGCMLKDIDNQALSMSIRGPDDPPERSREHDSDLDEPRGCNVVGCDEDQ